MHLFSRVFHRNSTRSSCCVWVVGERYRISAGCCCRARCQVTGGMRCCPLSSALDALSTRVLLYLFLPRSDLAWILSSSIGWSQVRLHRSSGRSCFSSTVLKWRQRASLRPTGGARATVRQSMMSKRQERMFIYMYVMPFTVFVIYFDLLKVKF